MPGTESIHVLPTDTYFAIIRQTLAETGQARVRVTGMSMWPLLHHLRDTVVIVPPTELHFGDIILYDRRNGKYALHRVVHKKRDSFTMAGDNQWYLDRNLSYNQVVGIVTEINRNGRNISCKNLLIKIYALLVAFFSFPRIYLWRIIKKLPLFNHLKRKGVW